MKAIICNLYPEQDYYKDKKPKAWDVKLSTYHINCDFKRNELLKISNGDRKIYLYAKGVSYFGLVQNHIWIDYDTRVELGVDFDSLVQVTKANVIEKFLIAPLKSPVPWERNNQIWNLSLAILFFILGIYIK